MKKSVAMFTICAVAASLILTSACSKKAEEPAAPAAPEAPVAAAPAPTPTTAAPDTAKTEAAIATPGAGGLTPQQIADSVSKSVCKRMTTCNPQGGSETDCVSGLSKDMAANLSDSAKAIAQAQLDTCLASITKATCEQLAAPTPPAGCEFMN